MQRVAVIGAGTMGRIHCEAYARMSNAELVAICDARADVAESLAKEYSAQSFPSIETMLAEVEVDAVDICTPTSTHLQCIKAAAAAGKAVACEKPLARSIGQAQEALHACEDAGVTLFVAHVVRWFPEYRRLHDLIAGGAVGDAVEVRTSRGGVGSEGVGGWFSDFKQSGGVVMDLIIHDFDWLRWCFGTVKRVYARGLYDAGIAHTDYALVSLRFENGVIAHVEGDWARPTGFATSVEVAGQQGLLNYSSADSTPITITRKGAAGQGAGTIVPESPTMVSPYYLELRHFIDCLEEGRAPEVRGEDGLEAVRVAEAALRSINTGQPVVLAHGGEV